MHEEEKLKILRELFGHNHKSNHEYLFHCPKCPDNNKLKLSVNLDKNVFKCWTCDYRGKSVSRLVKRYGSFGQRKMWESLSGEVDISQPLDNLFENQEKETLETRISLPNEFISLCNSKLPLSSLEPRKYLTERGITKEDVLKWKMGFAKEGIYAGRVIIPSFNNEGHINYFVARSYLKNKQAYMNPSISKDIVYNSLYVDWKNDLTLVEGLFDAFKADNSVPLLGSSLSENSKLFQEIVKHDTPLYLALDPDAETKAMRLIKNLLLYDVEIYKVDVTGFDDVGEMTKEEFRKRKDKAVLMTQENFLENQWRI